MGKNMKKEDGVSPVIAVMLILGLTVVLLGMAAAMFMGITSNATDNMNTSFLHPTNEWDVIKIVYNANGGTGTVPIDESAPHNPGDIVTVAKGETLYRPDYEFEFWNTKSDNMGDSYLEGDKLVINEYTTLYAIWSVINNYFVIYMRNGNDEYFKMPSNSYEKKGVEVDIANCGSSENKTFVNWLDKINNKYYNPGDTYNGTNGNIILYAVWEDNPKPQNP